MRRPAKALTGATRFGGSNPLPFAIFLIRNGACSVSLVDLCKVGAVKVKCVRVRSEGWSPHIFGRVPERSMGVA